VTFAFPVAHREYAEPKRRNYSPNGVQTSWMGA
jgi:hypothetical protein